MRDKEQPEGPMSRYVKPEPWKLAANRISEQLTPVNIAKELKVPTSEAIRVLFIAIGEGLIRESDLFFVLVKKYPEEAARLGSFECSQKKLRAVLPALFPDADDLDELMLLFSYLKRRVYVGDMYVFLTELERTLHKEIESILKKKFGWPDTGWWKQGVPEAVRVKCAEARERDAEFVAHPYSYTTFIHLKEILQGKPKLFSDRLPVPIGNDMKSFFLEMDRLNRIRNQVMHPVRAEPPTEKDFEFVREMHQKLTASLWR